MMCELPCVLIFHRTRRTVAKEHIDLSRRVFGEILSQKDHAQRDDQIHCQHEKPKPISNAPFRTGKKPCANAGQNRQNDLNRKFSRRLFEAAVQARRAHRRGFPAQRQGTAPSAQAPASPAPAPQAEALASPVFRTGRATTSRKSTPRPVQKHTTEAAAQIASTAPRTKPGCNHAATAFSNTQKAPAPNRIPPEASPRRQQSRSRSVFAGADKPVFRLPPEASLRRFRKPPPALSASANPVRFFRAPSC